MAKKVLKGLVVSCKNHQTIIVEVKKVFVHPKYKKIVTKSSRYSVHDQSNLIELGQILRIEESTPISKTKKWIVVN